MMMIIMIIMMMMMIMIMVMVMVMIMIMMMIKIIITLLLIIIFCHVCFLLFHFHLFVGNKVVEGIQCTLECITKVCAMSPSPSIWFWKPQIRLFATLGSILDPQPS